MVRSRSVRIATAVAATLLIAVPAGPTAFAATGTEIGSAAYLGYSSNSPDAQQNVHALRPDGTRTQLTGLNDFQMTDLTMSNSGGHVGYTGYQKGSSPVSELWAVEAAAGATPRRLAPGQQVISHTWSPDDSRLAFVSAGDGAPRRLWIVNRDGSGLRMVTEALQLIDIAWSPAGDQLAAAVSEPTGTRDDRGVPNYTTALITLGLDGRKLRTVATGADIYIPFWVPATDRLVWSERASAAWHIVSARADGADARTVARDRMVRGVSRDGRRLLYATDAFRIPQIQYGTMTLDGTDLRSIGSGQAEDGTNVYLLVWDGRGFYDGRFWDDDSNTHQANIERIAGLGITSGCDTTGTAYCPGVGVTRAQMASFLARAFELPAAGADYFSDDAGSPHEDNINRVHAAGIAQGVAPGLFRPLSVVTRDQMASFIARALGLSPTSAHRFSDVSGSHADSIHALFDAGITTGCTGDGSHFCPGQPVLRGPMASFVARSLDHAAAQPAP